ncbi:MAG: DUF2975 domain-containing protein [Cytophagales bacterium]|nr:DUF2975 domain-containing protein [Rhizobacter sp.]
MNPALPLLPPDSPALARIRHIAWWVRGLMLLAGVVLVSLPLAFWLNPVLLAQALSAMPKPGAASLTPTIRLVTVAALLPLVAMVLFGLQQLWRLFDGYARGEVFTEIASTRLRRLAIVMMLMCLVKPLTGAVMSVILSWNNPPGQRAITLGLSSDDYVYLLLGAVLLAIASVMREAARLAQENAEFV